MYLQSVNRAYVLNVLPAFISEHKSFVTVAYGEKLKISLILNSSLVQLFYTPASDSSPRLLLDKGEFTSVTKIVLFYSYVLKPL